MQQREPFFLEVPVGSTVMQVVPAGRLLVVTRACLDISPHFRLPAAAAEYSGWVSLSCAQAGPTSEGLPKFHAVAALAVPTDRDAAAAGQAANLQLMLTDDASFSAAWKAVLPQPSGSPLASSLGVGAARRHSGGSGGRPSGEGGGVVEAPLPGASVHLSGYLEWTPEP